MPFPTVSTQCAVAVALSLVLSPAAWAQDLVDATNPEKILEIARGYGSAELEVDKDNDPLIVGRMNGFRYKVFFFGCDDGKDCKSIQFWTFTKAPQNALEAVNKWNREYRFGRGYLDKEGDITIEMDVNLWGGVTPKNLDDSFDYWRLVMEEADKVFEDPAVPAEEPTQTPGDTKL